MARSLKLFEGVVRRSSVPDLLRPIPIISAVDESLIDQDLHPFDKRNIHPDLPKKVRTFFDNGHYAESTFEAFKFLDKLVQRNAGSSKTGEKLMLEAFNEVSPVLKLNLLATQSDIDEQRGYRFMLAGAMAAIRNPRGHEVDFIDDVDTCLDHLAFASLLIRRLEQAGFN